MIESMVKRPTYEYPMPLAEGITVLYPQFAVVKFSSGTLDIGALCYAQRTVSDKNTRRLGRKVVLDSLMDSRISIVGQLIAHISDLAATKRLRMETLHERFRCLLVFVTWADTNKWPDVLSGIDAAKPAIRAYLEHVRERVMLNNISLNTGAKVQSNVVRAMEEFLETEHLGRGLNLLVRDKTIAEATVPPSETNQGRVLSLCNCLFDGICQLVVDQFSYPYALSTPSHLGFPNDQLWIFPAKAWFKTPAMIEAFPMHAGYNYIEGRLATLGEVRTQYSRIDAPKEITCVARKCIRRANENYNDSRRWHLARKASNSFLILFIAATGMNWSEAINLVWSDDYEVGTTNQGFRALKWRAGGRLVSFELPISFLPRFKRYLALRNYILQGKQCDYLFFSSLKVSDPPGPIRSDFSRAYEMLRSIDPAINTVMPRAWRAAKSDWLVRHTDPSTAALVLQNSEKTVLEHYAQGSETLHHEEMSKFLNEVAGAVLAPGETLENPTERALGGCTSFGTPVAIVSQTRVKPDCDSVEGCLFCDKFRVHADEGDSRKLLSCRYAIVSISPLSNSQEEFNELFKPILDRIDRLISEIAVRDPAMIEKVKREVDEDGELDPYWAGKIETLMTLGLI